MTLEAATGSLRLRWKAANPASGTSYIIRRKLPGESAFAFVGISGKKRFVDDTLELGSSVREGIHAPAVQYTVQGQRADRSGPLSPVFTVKFGQAADGERVAALTRAPSMGGATSRETEAAVLDAMVRGGSRRAHPRVAGV